MLIIQMRLLFYLLSLRRVSPLQNQFGHLPVRYSEIKTWRISSEISGCRIYKLKLRLRLAVRLGEGGKVRAAQEVAQVAGQLFAGEVGGHCGVQRFGAQQDGDRPRGALAQERRCVRAAVDQTEVLPRAGVLATGRPAAYGGCFEVLGRSIVVERCADCLLYTSPSPRDRQKSRMPSSA